MNQEKCFYDYANKCDCSEDDKCGCTFPNNLAHDFDCDFLSDEAFSFNGQSEKLRPKPISERLPHDIIFEHDITLSDEASTAWTEGNHV